MDSSEFSSYRSRRLSNASSSRRSSNASDASSQQRQQLLQQQPQRKRPPAVATDGRMVNADGDGPSLAAALNQSIRHHSRMLEGERQDPVILGAGGVAIAGVARMPRIPAPAYDPYQDDDHVTLAPDVELNYGKDSAASRKGGLDDAMALREFVANAAVAEVAPPTSSSAGRGTTSAIDETVERQQQRIEMLRRDESTFGVRFARNISNWFRMDGGAQSSSSSGGGGGGGGRTVRFAGVDDELVAVIADGGEAVPGVPPEGGFDPRAPRFVVPSPAMFRTATRHPSHLPASSEFDNAEARLDAPRRTLEARKRHRRNDSALRLMIAVLCFGFSLAFAIVYGEGKFGLAVTTMAYEHKVERSDLKEQADAHQLMQEMMMKEEVLYPDWWEQEKGVPDMEGRDVKFSPTLEYNAADVTTPRAPDRIETPFFWTVPRSGGNAIRTIMSNCLRLAEASEYGAGSDQPFLIVEERDGKRFVNVDMTTTEGLFRANELKLTSSGVADVVISGDIHGVLNLFNNRNRARIFAVFRHPMERAISKYYADLASIPEMAGMTLPQYVRSGGYRVENNYLTRYLSGRYGGNLLVHHLDIAREFLRRKFVVGLASDLPTSAEFFSHVFGWHNSTGSLGLENVDLCNKNIYNSLSNKPPPRVEEGSEGWKLLVAQNWFDLKLYEYVEHLFQLQLDQLKLTKSRHEDGSVSRI
ncbi:hypothetical protein ACHAW5_006036 [Stephanodiscus triporus]|uniref:Sulfotransferase domain-containing protein n=1 Tax=Stephanodiscus triporus TaxID=2934178 RepID=A0ABD3QBB1_9STRA